MAPVHTLIPRPSCACGAGGVRRRSDAVGRRQRPLHAKPLDAPLQHTASPDPLDGRQRQPGGVTGRCRCRCRRVAWATPWGATQRSSPSRPSAPAHQPPAAASRISCSGLLVNWTSNPADPYCLSTSLLVTTRCCRAARPTPSSTRGGSCRYRSRGPPAARAGRRAPRCAACELAVPARPARDQAPGARSQTSRTSRATTRSCGSGMRLRSAEAIDLPHRARRGRQDGAAVRRPTSELAAAAVVLTTVRGCRPTPSSPPRPRSTTSARCSPWAGWAGWAGVADARRPGTHRHPRGAVERGTARDGGPGQDGPRREPAARTQGHPPGDWSARVFRVRAPRPVSRQARDLGCATITSLPRHGSGT